MLLTDMWVESHFKVMGSQDLKRVSQNGLKYKTICSNCNSYLSDFDRPYIDFVQELKNYLKMSECLVVPYKFRTEVQIVKIVKSILGHLLASKTEFCSSKYDDLTRDYVMGDAIQLPEGFRLFFWFYDYNKIIIRNDIFELNVSTGINSHFSVIKSFPIAFAISYDGKNLNNTTELKLFNSDTLTSKREIVVDLRIQNWWNYPEGNNKNVFHLVPKDHTSVIATHKHKIISKGNK